ncbi:hypothetical protein Tco_0257333 [Tanacetum coccineum]
MTFTHLSLAAEPTAETGNILKSFPVVGERESQKMRLIKSAFFVDKAALIIHLAVQFDATTFSDGKPASETSELNPEDVTARLEDIEVEIDTLHADTEDKELLISELQDSLAAAENEIALLQIRVADAEDRRAEDHDQIQTILAHLGL